jgi:hypothetical protein
MFGEKIIAPADNNDFVVVENNGIQIYFKVKHKVLKNSLLGQNGPNLKRFLLK